MQSGFDFVLSEFWNLFCNQVVQPDANRAHRSSINLRTRARTSNPLRPELILTNHIILERRFFVGNGKSRFSSLFPATGISQTFVTRNVFLTIWNDFVVLRAGMAQEKPEEHKDLRFGCQLWNTTFLKSHRTWPKKNASSCWKTYEKRKWNLSNFLLFHVFFSEGRRGKFVKNRRVRFGKNMKNTLMEDLEHVEYSVFSALQNVFFRKPKIYN